MSHEHAGAIRRFIRLLCAFSCLFYREGGTDCFKLKGISKRDIIKAFALIDSQIMPIRKKLSKKDTWSVMTLIVDDEGNFKADFEYEDISEDSIGYYQRWKEKYLN